MTSPSSGEVLHPTNPPMLRDMNKPKGRGQTRVLPDGSLLYLEPITREEVPAVRLETIRPRLVEEASKKKSYRFPKKRGYEDTNVTAFVKRDYNFGSKRAHRPDRLFQIHSSGSKGEKPEGYVMDGDRIVLDGFDHGLRNFGNQLPLYVSSELEGHDIEDYLRRNREISVYDLIARAPNGYFQGPPELETKGSRAEEKPREWHVGPPRVGTFSMRATRFRLAAGLLSWETKDGTAAKNQRILDLIPAEFKNPAVNSTKGWRDLNKEELEIVKAGALRKPQQGPKEKRAAQAAKERESMESAGQNSAERGKIVKDSPEIQDVGNDAGVGRSNYQDSIRPPEIDLKDYRDSKPASQSYCKNRNGNYRHTPIDLDGYPLKPTNPPSQQDSMQSRKRSRGTLDQDNEESSDSNRTAKRTRVTTDSYGLGNQGGFSRMGISGSGRQPQRPVRAPAPTPAPVPKVYEGLAYPTLNSNTLRSTSRPLPFNATFPSPSPASAAPRHQMHPSSDSSNTGLVLPNMYNSSRLQGSGDNYSSLQASLTQNEGYHTSQSDLSLGYNPSYRYTQPDTLQRDEANSWSLGLESSETPGSYPLYDPTQPDAFQIDQASSWFAENLPYDIPWLIPSYGYTQPDANSIDQASNWSLGPEPCETLGSNPLFGSTQPVAFQSSLTYSQTFGPLYANNGIDSGLNTLANDGEYYLPESDFSYQEPTPTPQHRSILHSTNPYAQKAPSKVKDLVEVGPSTGINPALLTLQ